MPDRSPGGSTVLRALALSRTFPVNIKAVQDFNIDFDEGSFTVIVGPSGCGKTTLLKLLAGLEKPDGGEILFTGGDPCAASREPTVDPAPRFGFMFQDARLLPWLTVEENLRLAFPPRLEKTAAEEIEKNLNMLGLADWKNAYPRKLSGGMAQRAALARALCRKPRILLLDEPFGALDAFTRARLRLELAELWRSLHITVVLVTHDIEETVFFADRIILMKNGSHRGEHVVNLARPRDLHAPEFQRLCADVELDLARI
jgi:ABC-type nitrate/sulfonate/bicarbonate transport system ATPase subunit